MMMNSAETWMAWSTGILHGELEGDIPSSPAEAMARLDKLITLAVELRDKCEHSRRDTTSDPDTDLDGRLYVSWRCPDCRGEMESVVEGDLETDGPWLWRD